IPSSPTERLGSIAVVYGLLFVTRLKIDSSQTVKSFGLTSQVTGLLANLKGLIVMSKCCLWLAELMVNGPNDSQRVGFFLLFSSFSPVCQRFIVFLDRLATRCLRPFPLKFFSFSHSLLGCNLKAIVLARCSFILDPHCVTGISRFVFS